MAGQPDFTKQAQVSGATIIGGTPSTQAFGDSAALGTGTNVPAIDHKHGMPAAPPSTQTDVTASRAYDGTVYHNTTSKPITVTVTVNMAGSIKIIAYSDANADPTTVVAGTGATSVATSLPMSCTFTVLPGNYYKVILTDIGGAGTKSLASWIEWS